MKQNAGDRGDLNHGGTETQSFFDRVCRKWNRGDGRDESGWEIEEQR